MDSSTSNSQFPKTRKTSHPIEQGRNMQKIRSFALIRRDNIANNILFSYESHNQVIKKMRSTWMTSTCFVPIDRIFFLRYDNDEQIWHVHHRIDEFDQAILDSISEFIWNFQANIHSQYICSVSNEDNPTTSMMIEIPKFGRAKVNRSFKYRTDSDMMRYILRSDFIFPNYGTPLLINPSRPDLLILALFVKGTEKYTDTNPLVSTLIENFDHKTLLICLKKISDTIISFMPHDLNEETSNVLTQMAANDLSYFLKKKRTFAKEIFRFQNAAKKSGDDIHLHLKLLAEIVSRAKKEYTVGIIWMLRHYYNMSGERHTMFRNFNHVPYVRMLAKLHADSEKIKAQRREVTDSDTIMKTKSILQHTYDSVLKNLNSRSKYINYGFVMELSETIISRREILIPAYQYHRLSIIMETKPRDNNYESYYPCRVFDSAFTILEHLLFTLANNPATEN